MKLALSGEKPFARGGNRLCDVDGGVSRSLKQSIRDEGHAHDDGKAEVSSAGGDRP